MGRGRPRPRRVSLLLLAQGTWPSPTLYIRYRKRRIPSGTAQNHLSTGHDAHDRVVHVAHNRAVVNEEEVGNAAESYQRLALIAANRLVTQVAAGGDDGGPEQREQQMMQRCVGEHKPQVWIAGGD